MDFRAGYEATVTGMSAEKQRLWNDLKSRVDQEFSQLNRSWRSRGYFVKADRNFFVIEPKKSGRIEARAHANAEDIPPLDDIWHVDKEHSQKGRDVNVQTYRIEKQEDIEKVMTAARVAREVWGIK